MVPPAAPPGEPGVRPALPPVTPLMETSARAPPFFAGSMVRDWVRPPTFAAAEGSCSQTPEWPWS
jgi:hypothetical protein